MYVCVCAMHTPTQLQLFAVNFAETFRPVTVPLSASIVFHLVRSSVSLGLYLRLRSYLMRTSMGGTLRRMVKNQR